jgi:hypothetical protein
MYLFTRRRSIGPSNATEAVPWVIETAAKATQICGIPVSAWTSMWGEDAGTVVWSAFVDDLTGLEQAGDKLAVDSAFNERIREAEHLFNGPVVDTLAQIIHGTPPTEPNPYVSAVVAQLANGHIRDGVAGAIAIAEAAERVTGHPTSVSMSVTGAYGGIAWLSGYADLAALEAAEGAINADAEFVALIDRTSPCYQPAAQQAIYRRLS